MTLAPYLRTIQARYRGIAASQDPVKAFCRRARTAPLRVAITYSDWAFRKFLLADQGVDSKGRPEWLPVWPSPGTWDSPGTRNVDSLRYDGSMPPAPLLLPWNSKRWAPGTAPKGMDGDFGVLIDDTPDGMRGWELLGLRKPNIGEALVLTWRSKPWIFGTPTFVPGHWCADAFFRRTELNVGTFAGCGAGNVRGGKRRNITCADEVATGVIEHPLQVTDFRVEHGPGGRFVLPATRREHDGDPCPSNPTPPGIAPDQTYPHGTSFAHTWTKADLVRIGNRNNLSAAEFVVFMIFATAMALGRPDDGYGDREGYGWVITDTACGPDPQVITDGPIPGLTAATSAALLDGVLDPAHLVVLEPIA